jgi:hypothetical protein
LVEIGVVEIHPWGATVDDIEHPDTLVFDLDPGEVSDGVFVVDTAFRLRDTLAAEGHDCWPKTTNGKGLHVMVPIKPDMTWDTAHDHTRDIAEQLAATATSRLRSTGVMPRCARRVPILERTDRTKKRHRRANSTSNLAHRAAVITSPGQKGDLVIVSVPASVLRAEQPLPPLGMLASALCRWTTWMRGETDSDAINRVTRQPREGGEFFFRKIKGHRVLGSSTNRCEPGLGN